MPSMGPRCLRFARFRERFSSEFREHVASEDPSKNRLYRTAIGRGSRYISVLTPRLISHQFMRHDVRNPQAIASCIMNQNGAWHSDAGRCAPQRIDGPSQAHDEHRLRTASRNMERDENGEGDAQRQRNPGHSLKDMTWGGGHFL